MTYISWDMKCDEQNFCHFGPVFAYIPPPPKNLKNQNFEKLKKTLRDIIILPMCTINNNQMMYGSWDIECDRQTFLSFWAIFCHFFGPFWKNLKKIWRYYHFTKVYQKSQSYDVCFLRHGVRQTRFFVILGYFLPFYPTNKIKIWKIMKKTI